MKKNKAEAAAKAEPNEEPEVIRESAESQEGEVIDIPSDQKQNTELLDRLQRTLAEFDNFRKRTLREKASMYDDGARDTLEKLLPVVDNLERALSATEDKESGLYKGIEMTFRQLSEILTKMGVEPLPGVGTAFDPNLHNAVAHVEDEALGENIIAEEMQKGYKYKDKILRPSMVKVAN